MVSYTFKFLKSLMIEQEVLKSPILFRITKLSHVMICAFIIYECISFLECDDIYSFIQLSII